MFGLSQDNLVHLILAAIGLGWFIVQLSQNGKLGEIRLLIQQGNGKMDSHIASDEQKHAAIDSHLEATDKMVVWLRDRA